MQIRRLLLKVMLWLLGLSALTGVFAFLIAESWFIWRTTWTGIVAAIAAGLLIPLSLATDQEKTRPAGLLGMSLVVVEFLLALLLIWFSRVNWVSRYDEQFVTSMGFIFLCGVPSMALLFARPFASLQIMGTAGAILGGVSFIGYEIAIWSDVFASWQTERNLWLSANSFSGYAVMSVVLLAGFQADDHHYDRWVGMGCAVLGFALALTAVWVDDQPVRDHIVWITTLGILLAHARVVSLARLSGSQIWVRWATIASLVLCGILSDVFLIRDLHHMAEIEFLGRSAGAAGIAASCGTLAIVVLAAINRRGQYVTSVGPIKTITFHCPKCQRKQTAPLGEARCIECGLVLRSSIELPECPECGYLLFGLTSDRCPECGCHVGAPAKAAGAVSQ